MAFFNLKYVPGAIPGKAPRPTVKRSAGDIAKKQQEYENEKRSRCYQAHWKEGRPWLNYSEEKMTCAWCIEAGKKSQWVSLRGQNAFLTGCTNFRVDSLNDHASSIGHQNAEKMHNAKTQPASNSTAGVALRQLTVKSREQLTLKMRNVHAVTKMGRRFTEYLHLCDLDEAKGLSPGTAYRNVASCSTLLQSIADPIRQKTKAMVDEARFVSLTSDGLTDVTGTEQESLYLRFCLKGTIIHRFLHIGKPEDTTAAGIFKFISEALEREGILNAATLVGFGSDGAANMMGHKTGVGVRLQELHTELVLVKCLAHRLESCFKDAVKKVNMYDRAMSLLIGLYYMYKKSPKQREHLLRCFKICNVKVAMPTRVGGTRWLGHLDHALDVFFRSYPAIVSHLQNNSHGNPKVEGFAKLAMSKSIIIFLLELQDIIKPLQILSKCLQRKDATLGESKELMDVTKDALSLCKTSCSDATVRVEETSTFKGTKLSTQGNPRSASSLAFKNVLVDQLLVSMQCRFSDINSSVLSATKLTNLNKWPSPSATVEIEEYGNVAIGEVTAHFNSSLQSQDIEPDSVSREWKKLKCIIYRNHSNELQTLKWSKVMQSYPESGIENVLAVISLLLSLPPTSVFNETSFSQMKYVKNNRRGRLSHNNLNNSLLVRIEGASIADFNVDECVENFIMPSSAGCQRRIRERCNRKITQDPAATSSSRMSLVDSNLSSSSDESDPSCSSSESE